MHAHRKGAEVNLASILESNNTGGSLSLKLPRCYRREACGIVMQIGESEKVIGVGIWVLMFMLHEHSLGSF
jgi:hypothetical protein